MQKFSMICLLLNFHPREKSFRLSMPTKRFQTVGMLVIEFYFPVPLWLLKAITASYLLSKT